MRIQNGGDDVLVPLDPLEEPRFSVISLKIDYS